MWLKLSESTSPNSEWSNTSAAPLNPSCLHTTLAALASQPSSQITPYTPRLFVAQTFPSLAELLAHHIGCIGVPAVVTDYPVHSKAVCRPNVPLVGRAATNESNLVVSSWWQLCQRGERLGDKQP